MKKKLEVSLTRETISPTPEKISSIFLPSLSTTNGVIPEVITWTVPTIIVANELSNDDFAAMKIAPILKRTTLIPLACWKATRTHVNIKAFKFAFTFHKSDNFASFLNASSMEACTNKYIIIIIII